MAMYPAYRIEHVLKMPAKTFMALLNEGYRERYRKMRADAQTALLPYLDKKDRSKYLKNLDMAAQDLSDILEPSKSGNAHGDDDIKRFFGQR